MEGGSSWLKNYGNMKFLRAVNRSCSHTLHFLFANSEFALIIFTKFSEESLFFRSWKSERQVTLPVQWAHINHWKPLAFRGATPQPRNLLPFSEMPANPNEKAQSVSNQQIFWNFEASKRQAWKFFWKITESFCYRNCLLVDAARTKNAKSAESESACIDAKFLFLAIGTSLVAFVLASFVGVVSIPMATALKWVTLLESSIEVSTQNFLHEA